VSFFDHPPPPPPREPERFRPPPWFGPPANVLPGAATFALLLANTGEVAVAVTGGLASPDGLEFTVHLRRRGPTRRRRAPDPFFEPDVRDEHGQVRDEVLRFGVEFADGRRASNPLGLLRPGAARSARCPCGPANPATRTPWPTSSRPLSPAPADAPAARRAAPRRRPPAARSAPVRLGPGRAGPPGPPLSRVG